METSVSGTGLAQFELRLWVALWRLGLSSGEVSDEEDVAGVSTRRILFKCSGDTILEMFDDEERRRAEMLKSPDHSSSND